jgi:hypothetical protein
MGHRALLWFSSGGFHQVVFRSGGFQISIIYSGLAAHGDKAMDKPGYVITTDTVVQLLNPACHHQIMVWTLMVGTSWLAH